MLSLMLVTAWHMTTVAANYGGNWRALNCKGFSGGSTAAYKPGRVRSLPVAARLRAAGLTAGTRGLVLRTRRAELVVSGYRAERTGAGRGSSPRRALPDWPEADSLRIPRRAELSICARRQQAGSVSRAGRCDVASPPANHAAFLKPRKVAPRPVCPA